MPVTLRRFFDCLLVYYIFFKLSTALLQNARKIHHYISNILSLTEATGVIYFTNGMFGVIGHDCLFIVALLRHQRSSVTKASMSSAHRNKAEQKNTKYPLNYSH